MHPASVLHYKCVMQKHVKKDAQIAVRVSTEAKQMVEELAAADGRSVANYLEHIIRRLHRRAQEQPKE